MSNPYGRIASPASEIHPAYGIEYIPARSRPDYR